MIYDYTTKNDSFIELAYQLKEEGIKNWNFFLVLFDEELVGVDPYDENLSMAMKLKIQREVINNYWYFIREVIKIPEAGGFTFYKLNKLNLATSFCMDLNLNEFIEGPRQSGKTIGVLCRYVWVYHYGTINSQMAFSNKKLDDSILNLKRFNNIFEMLPDYLKAHTDSTKDKSNQTYIECFSNKNNIQAMSSPVTKAAADQLGRGYTSPSIWWDEFGFLKFNGIVYAAAAPALTRAAEAAEKNGTPYGKTITTTPNDRDSYEGAYAYSIIEGAVRFDDSWYDMTYRQIKDIIDKRSSNNFVYIKYSYKQLGRTEAWFRHQCKELNNDLMKIKRELLLEWTLANDRSPFTEEQLSNIERNVKEAPIKSMYINNFKFDVYEELEDIFTTNWIVGVDIGGNLMLDYTVISITNPYTKKLQAIFKSNSIAGDDLIQLLEKMLTTFFPSAVIIPERNSLGLYLVERMSKSNIIRPRLYYEVKEKVAERTVKDVRINESVKFKTKVEVYGQTTDAKSRELMYNEILSYMVDEEPENIICPELFDEIKTLERNNRGRIAARNGAHDDVVMSWLIGLHALLYGRNINKFVSLNKSGRIVNGRLVTKDSEEYSKGIKKLYSQINTGTELTKKILEEQRKRELIAKIIDGEEDSKPISDKSERIKRNIRRMIR